MRANRDLRTQDRPSGRGVMKSRSVGMSACPDYERSDGLGLADLLRRRQVHPEELLGAAIVRVKERNPARGRRHPDPLELSPCRGKAGAWCASISMERSSGVRQCLSISLTAWGTVRSSPNSSAVTPPRKSPTRQLLTARRKRLPGGVVAR